MFRLKDEFDKMFFGDENPKVKAKKKLNAYYDLYGEDKMKLEDVLDGEDYYDYLMASGFADEVLAERRQKREAEEMGMLSQKAEELKEQKIKSDVKKAAALAEKEKQEAMGTYQDEREDYIPKDIEGKKKRAKQLMDKYGENLDVSEMNHKDFKAYLNLQDVLSEAKVERMHDEEVKKRKNLEYGLIDNFTPLKQTLKDDKKFKDMLVGAEGTYKYVYLDSKAIPTWGEGFNLSRKNCVDEKAELAALKKARPMLKGANRRATDEEIEREYAKLVKVRNNIEKARAEKIRRGEPVSKNKNDMVATVFEDVMKLEFTKEDIEKEYAKRLNEAIVNLESSVITYNQRVNSDNPKYAAYKRLEKMPGLKKFSPNVLMALIELSYNSGNLAGWKYLFDALARGDFQKAADESHRDDNHGKNGNIKKRNAWVYSKILSAVKKKELDK